MDTKAFHNLSYGLYIICSIDAQGRKVGCIANTFAQVASQPPTASVALNKENATTSAILETGRYTAVCLTVDATMDLIARFGFNTSYAMDKFDGAPFALDKWGLPYITQAVNAFFSVEVSETVDVGSHFVLIGEIIDAEILSEGESMTYGYYHRVLRGKTPPKAVSYVEGDEHCSTPAVEVAEAVECAEDLSRPGDTLPGDSNDVGPRYGWRCMMCGYIEEGYPDGLPADYQCPWCGAGPEMFERIEL